MQTKFLAVSISMVALLAAGCDPEAPVESSDVDAEIQAAITLHGDDTTTHGNLVVPAANVSGEFDSDQIAAGAIGNSELDVNSVGSEEIADGTIAIGDMGAGSVGTTQLADLSVSAAKIQVGSIDATKLAANSIVGGLAGVVMDGTITAFDLGAASVGTVQLMDDGVTTDDIANDTITDVNIADNTITAGSLANDSVGMGEIAADAVGTGEIAANTVAAVDIAADAVGASELANDAVDTTAIVDLAVDSTKLSALAVTQAKIDSDFVGRRVDAVGGAGANLNAVFVFTEPSGGAAIDITVVGACESTEAGSIVRLGDQSAACPDVGANNTIDGTPVLFRLVFNASNQNVTFSYDAGANNDTVAWEIYSFTVSGAP